MKKYYFLSYYFLSTEQVAMSPKEGFSNCVSDIHPFKVYDYIENNFILDMDMRIFQHWILLYFIEISQEEYNDHPEKYTDLGAALKLKIK